MFLSDACGRGGEDCGWMNESNDTYAVAMHWWIDASDVNVVVDRHLPIRTSRAHEVVADIQGARARQCGLINMSSIFDGYIDGLTQSS